MLCIALWQSTKSENYNASAKKLLIHKNNYKYTNNTELNNHLPLSDLHVLKPEGATAA